MFCPFVRGACVGGSCMFSAEQFIDEQDHECFLAGAAELIDYFGIHIYGYPSSAMDMLMKHLENVTNDEDRR